MIDKLEANKANKNEKDPNMLTRRVARGPAFVFTSEPGPRDREMVTQNEANKRLWPRHTVAVLY